MPVLKSKKYIADNGEEYWVMEDVNLFGSGINDFYASVDGFFKRVVLHRLSGPAIIGVNFKMWLRNGMRHSESGPAGIWQMSNGTLWKEYNLYGECLNYDEWFERLTEKQKIKALYNPENF